jgi:F-type H+-transporting ATPase subunit delta
MKQSPQAAARRYARALLEVAVAKGDPDGLRRELEQTAALIQSNDELRRALTQAGLGSERRRRVVKAVFASGSELLQRLLGLLAERGAIALVPQLAAAYDRQWNEHRGRVQAEAASAMPLDEAQREALAAALTRATGREVDLKTRVDAAVLGGLVVTMGGRTYDGSVRTQLQQLRQRLVRGTA